MFEIAITSLTDKVVIYRMYLSLSACWVNNIKVLGSHGVYAHSTVWRQENNTDWQAIKLGGKISSSQFFHILCFTVRELQVRHSTQLPSEIPHSTTKWDTTLNGMLWYHTKHYVAIPHSIVCCDATLSGMLWYHTKHYVVIPHSTVCWDVF